MKRKHGTTLATANANIAGAQTAEAQHTTSSTAKHGAHAMTMIGVQHAAAKNLATAGTVGS